VDKTQHSLIKLYGVVDAQLASDQKKMYCGEGGGDSRGCICCGEKCQIGEGAEGRGMNGVLKLAVVIRDISSDVGGRHLRGGVRGPAGDKTSKSTTEERS